VVIVSESEGVVNTVHEAVTGSGTTVGSILSGSGGGVGRLITDPLATQGVDGVKRTHTTSTDGDVTLTNVRPLSGVVRTQTRATRGVGLSQSRATGLLRGRLQDLNLRGDTSGQGLSDGDEVVGGSGHVVCLN